MYDKLSTDPIYKGDIILKHFLPILPITALLKKKILMKKFQWILSIKRVYYIFKYSRRKKNAFIQHIQEIHDIQATINKTVIIPISTSTHQPSASYGTDDKNRLLR